MDALFVVFYSFLFAFRRYVLYVYSVEMEVPLMGQLMEETEVNSEDVFVTKIRSDALNVIRKSAFEKGIITSPEGSAASACRWALTQFAEHLKRGESES